jgi:hypothetical protein
VEAIDARSISGYTWGFQIKEYPMDLQYDGRSIPIRFYGMPHIGKWMKVHINGVECVARQTKWGKYGNTYWTYKNITMYVREQLPDGAQATIEGLPDDFGAAEPPEPRKNYYVPKPKESPLVPESAV